MGFPLADIFERISSGLPRDYLCPNLRHLSFSLSDSLFPYIRLFLSPKIIEATISIPTASSHISSLPGLSLRYPDLKRLSIRGYSSQDASVLLRTLSGIALNLERIVDLGVDRIDRAAIDHLSQLPCLKSLHLDHPLSPDLAPAPPFRTSPHRPFLALRELCFGNATLDFAIQFVELLPDQCSLEFFSVGTTTLATKFTISQLYTALASRLSRHTLRTLYVAIDEDIPAPPASMIDHYVINRDVLGTLLCFTNLSRVSLTAPVGFNIDDATVWDIVRAWPRLRVFCLEHGYRTTAPV
ncbi:hypothetical protein MVEN_01771600 [Mycena venus]|uniref:F-box domain-containing protein n=1 Tax=Mycena venus TaxID=2733690 RepID=A0A8H7CPE6_9AGAR|nr:hypothetical protein MVEN_01771600 [Mycena venus]